MGIFTRGTKLWITFKDGSGKWRNVSTGHSVGEEAAAQAKLEAVLEAVAAQRPAPLVAGSGTVRAYAETWLVKRRERDLDWKNDRSRLEHHVLPAIGDMLLADVRARHLVDLFHHIRTVARPGKTIPAQRTVYNIYSVVSAMFRDAKLDDRIAQSPCELDERSSARWSTPIRSGARDRCSRATRPRR